jgi:hypothetical protein
MSWFAYAAAIAALVLTLLNLSLTAAVIQHLRDRGPAGDAHDAPPSFTAPGQRVGAFQTRTVSGDVLSESDLAAGDSLVAFVSLTCPPCQEVLAELAEGSPMPDRRLFVFVFGDDAEAETVAARLPRAVVSRAELQGPASEAFGGVEGYPRLMLVSDSVITASGITLAHVRGADGARVPAVGRA